MLAFLLCHGTEKVITLPATWTQRNIRNKEILKQINKSLMIFWFFEASIVNSLILLWREIFYCYILESSNLINQENVLWRNWNVTLSLDRFVAHLSHNTSGKHLPVSSTLHGDKIESFTQTCILFCPIHIQAIFKISL